jgi:hypothetical protein
MVRMQIQLTEAQLRVLRETASRQGVSVSELVRRAVDRWVETRALPSPDDQRRRAVAAAGRFRSGASDVSERHDEYLAKAFEGT